VVCRTIAVHATGRGSASSLGGHPPVLSPGRTADDSPTDGCPLSCHTSLGCRGAFGTRPMSVDDRGGEIDEFAVVDTRPIAQHLKGRISVNRMAFHEDSFGTLDHGATPEGALEVVVLSESTQDYVDRALPVLDIVIGDMREHTAFGCFLDERGVRPVQKDDDGAGSLMHDLVDQIERVLGAGRVPLGPEAGGIIAAAWLGLAGRQVE